LLSFVASDVKVVLAERRQVCALPVSGRRGLKERAVRLVLESRDQYKSEHAAIRSIAAELVVGPESLRNWVRQAEVDANGRPGTTTKESA
jgi:transposase-like protein